MTKTTGLFQFSSPGTFWSIRVMNTKMFEAPSFISFAEFTIFLCRKATLQNLDI